MNLHTEKHLPIDSPAIRLVFTLIRQNDGISKQKLQDKLAIPATTLSRLIDKLLAAGYIEESGFTNETGGRPASLYKTAPNSGYLIGLDLSGLSSQVILMNLDLTTLDSTTLPGMTELKSDAMANSIEQAVKSLLHTHQIPAQKVLGCGLGWTGYTGSRYFAKPADALAAEQPAALLQESETSSPDQDNRASRADYALDVGKRLAEHTDFYIAMLPGADAALYAGIWLDRSLAEKTLIYLALGRSIRAGIVQQGQFHHHELNTGTIDDLLIPGKGKHAALRLDEVATRQAMLTAFRKIRKNNQETWDSFCKAAEKGKKKAGQVLDEASEAMVAAIYNSTVLSGADYLLLDGDLLYALPGYQNALLKKLTELDSSRQSLVFIEQPATISQTEDIAAEQADDVEQADTAEQANAAEQANTSNSRQVIILHNPYGEKIAAAGAAAYVLESALTEKLK